MSKSGTWWVGSRGTNPRPWQSWTFARYEDFDEAVEDFMAWRKTGQHVQLQWVPENVYNDGKFAGPTE